MPNLKMVEGIGDAYAQKLQDAGVATTDSLLEMGATPQGRKSIAERSGIPIALILRWVNHVDLYRINGVGEEFADLLEAAGVDTVPELAQRIPENLYQKMMTVTEEENRVRQLPSETQISSWVEQAKKLPRMISH